MTNQQKETASLIFKERPLTKVLFLTEEGEWFEEIDSATNATKNVEAIEIVMRKKEKETTPKKQEEKTEGKIDDNSEQDKTQQ